MPRPKHKYFYLYKTINLINNKYYYGMHSTSNLNDGYLGSGLRLRRSIRKYGKENFKIEIIEFFNSREELIDAEIKLITELVINEDLCMNIKLGGTGGFCNDEHQLKCSLAGNKKLKELFKDDKFKQKYSLICKKRAIKHNTNKNFKNLDNWKGKNRTQETKDKIGNANSIKQKGEKNSQYGTCWITKEGINKKIKKEELNTYLNSNWIKGRKYFASIALT